MKEMPSLLCLSPFSRFSRFLSLLPLLPVRSMMPSSINEMIIDGKLIDAFFLRLSTHYYFYIIYS